MTGHFHALTTPAVSLERAMQFIKGGFSLPNTHNLVVLSESSAHGVPGDRSSSLG